MAEASMETAGTYVVHLIGSLDVGGAETVALDLCRSIPSSVVHQTFVCLSGRDGALAEDFRSAGAHVVPLTLRSPTSLWRLRKVLKRGSGADAVVSHVSLASGPLLLWARVCGVPQRTARFHSQDDGRGSGIIRTVYRAAARALVALSATHVLGVTTSSVDFGLGCARGIARRRRVEIGVVPNGVNQRRFTPRTTPLATQPLVVVHVGRASPEKNRAILAPISRALRAQGPSDVRLVGSTETADLGAESGELTVIGPVRDVASELQQAHVLLLPSLWEGLPTVVLEALACGVPVVASDLPGIREIAAQVKGVHLVRLGSRAETWADVVRGAAGADATGVRDSFLSSAFTLDQTVEVWTRHFTAGPRHPLRPAPNGAT